MFSIQIIKHSKASTHDLNRAIAIKQTAWPYPQESQLLWMQNNLQPNDLHFFLQEDGMDVAYLNIAWVHVCLNGIDTLFAGIGNVCAKQIHGGYGKKLIENVVKELKEKKLPGILFCRNSLVGFYSKYNWCLINPKQISLPNDLKNINTMVCNIGNIESIVYNDRNF